MRKYLLASAILLPVISTANAQSAVTLAGIVDGGIGFRTGADAKGNTQWGFQSGAVQTSQFVLKGTEDLGGGYSTYFYLAAGFLLGNGASTNARLPTTSGSFLFDRGAWVGFKSVQLGSIQLGRNFTPFADFLYQTDASGYANFASLSNTIYQNLSGITGAQYTWGNNAVKYLSPEFGGLSAELMQSIGGVAGDFAAGRMRSAALFYKYGPIAINGAYLDANNPGGTAGSSLVARSYAVGALYSGTSFRASLNATNFRNPQIRTNQTFYSAGASYYLTPFFDIVADYTFLADKVAARDGMYMKLGAHYLLSKATDVYMEGGIARNHSRGTVGVASVFPSNPGINQTGLMLGLRKYF
ncbi:porin [Paraburkholderia elongata]|nr:porin [Paraburkholderia elongata]